MTYTQDVINYLTEVKENCSSFISKLEIQFDTGIPDKTLSGILYRLKKKGILEYGHGWGLNTQHQTNGYRIHQEE